MDEVRSVLERAGLGGVASSVAASAGERNRVWLVRTSQGLDVVVRFLADDRRFVMEQRVLELAAGAGVPVAEVLWAEREPSPVLVQRRLPGRMLAEVGLRSPAISSVAEMLRTIHGLPIASGFGNLGADLCGEASSLASWFIDDVVAEVGVIRSPVPGAIAAAVEELEAARPLLDRQRPGLVHGDLQPFNVLVGDDGQVTGVLDWEAAKSGPPAFDFGWWDWFSQHTPTPWSTEELLEHYGDVPEETDALRNLVMLRIEIRMQCSRLSS